MRSFFFAAALAALPFVLVACGDDDDKNAECKLGDSSSCGDGLECQAVEGGEPACFCSVDSNTGCKEQGLVCEAVADGNSDCFQPVTVQGRVFDLESGEPIEGARVVSRDANFAAVSGVTLTDANGEYALRVPARRDADGKVLESSVTMRADAAGYQTFPQAPRVALPVQLGTASGDPLVVKTAATDIAMLPLENLSGLGTIRGKVLHDSARGTLVVAGGASGTGGGVTGVADHDGTYAVFNVPAGSVTVSGYKAGLRLEPESATVSAGQVVEGVDLASLGDATAIVSGKIEIVNPGAGKDTSVILAVDETFDDTTALGEAPPGLRVYPVNGDFQIANVPDGNYVVLAAFENDFLVRDPDQAIGGTSIVRITVNNQNINLSESFKVTGALDVVSPDNEAVVTGTPTFVWVDDSGEDHYEIVVFDAFGHLIWEDLAIPGVSGSKNVTVQYAGDPLTSGVIYQFRATSIKQGGTSISRTEDLRGTFLYE